MSQDPEKPNRRQERKERLARLAKFTPEANEAVAEAIRVNESFVPQNGTIGPGLNNQYARPIQAKKIEIKLPEKKK